MTRPSGAHLSADEIDAWLAGTLAEDWQQHLDHCQACLDRARAEREIVDQLSGLPLMGPSTGFADRVMAAVAIPDPFAIRSLQATRRRLLASPRSLAVAASLALLLIGSVAGSIVWTLANQETMANLGSWLIGEAGQAAWLGFRGLASSLFEQPWYGTIQSLAENPARLALASALATFAYLGGILALRRLMAAPAQQVAHASI
jgi:hypothetical protein